MAQREAGAGGRRAAAENLVARLRDEMGEEWPPRLYRERVLAIRTRSHQVPAPPKGSRVEIQHTLLGIELKAGRRRVLCPDLATARYLQVFARAGLSEVAVPYDITKISRLADDLESAWQRMLLLADHLTEGRPPAARARLRSAAAREARRELEEAGAGTPVPQFRQDTRQRPRASNEEHERGGRRR
ncbi:MAG TPA: hypothetical protein VN228_09900 [Pyrinomonadaceae bacterium]|nr:hypothetical protein [Pyrinomonadaceae bacterium]